MDAEVIEARLKQLRWSRRLNLIILVVNVGLLLWVQHNNLKSRRMLDRVEQIRIEVVQLLANCGSGNAPHKA